MKNDRIKKGLDFAIRFYGNFVFHKEIAIVSLEAKENNYVELHRQVDNALKVSLYLKNKGYSIFENVFKHLELAKKETYVFAKYQKNGERNKSPVLVNINYEKINKDDFCNLTKERLDSLSFIQQAFV